MSASTSTGELRDLLRSRGNGDQPAWVSAAPPFSALTPAGKVAWLKQGRTYRVEHVKFLFGAASQSVTGELTGMEWTRRAERITHLDHILLANERTGAEVRIPGAEIITIQELP